LRTRIAVLERHAAGTPLGDESSAILAETDQVLEVFASLMRLWEIEGGQRRSHFVSVDLEQLVHEVGETLAPVAEDADDTLSVQTTGPAALSGDVHLLRQMVVNLVENAIRHTPAATRIDVFVRATGTAVEIGVADDGPGIPADAHDTVILRFGRLESSIDRPGHGLGLTLVDAIARLHGGSLRLEDAAPGLRAVVMLPNVP
jgi:signal transduction histidine kinase